MSEQGPHPRKERVLVVDDAREIREFLRESVLEPQGFEVLTAADGLEGLQLAFFERPDLMIVDVQMPHMSGLELLRRLRLRRLDIPAILITAHGSEQVAVKALRLGVRDYVIKPFVIDEMEKAIERALRERRLREERNLLTKQLQRSNANLRRRAQQLNAVYSIGQAVASSLQLEEVLERVVEAAVYLSRADEGALMLSGDQRGDLYVRAAKKITSEARTLREPVEDSRAVQALQSRQPVIVEQPNAGPASPDDPPLTNVAYVPLLSRGEAIGVLRVTSSEHKHALSKRDTQVLSILASFAASAIQNARLHERIVRESNQIQTVIEVSADPVLVLDQQKQLLLVNRAARDLLALPPGELRGQPARKVIGHRQLLAFIEGDGDGQQPVIEGRDGSRFQVEMLVGADGARSVTMHQLSER